MRNMTNETEKVVGVIEDHPRIKPGNTNDNAWTRTTFKIGGMELNTFDTNYSDFRMGDTVEVEYVIQGNWKNIKSMKKSEALPPTTEATTVPPLPTSAPAKTTAPSSIYVDKEMETRISIETQVISKIVGEMVCAGKIEPGNFKANMDIIAKAYKDTKKTLME